VAEARPALGEFELIRRFFDRRSDSAARRTDVLLGIGDDAALLAVPPQMQLVAAVDNLVEGRHFPAGTDPRSIGHRALAVNLSDMAAMGAVPAWATLALTLPAVQESWLESFAAGFMQLAAEHDVALVGGNTTRGALNVCVQIMGLVPHGSALRREGGRAGDLLVVTGTLGDAAAGLAQRLNPRPGGADLDALLRRFDYPQPRVQFGIAARGIASAAMDLSDGLSGDLPKLAAASGLSARVEVSALPLSAALRASQSKAQARALALSGGEDYELLLCVAPARYTQLQRAAAQLNLTLTHIGELRAGSGVEWLEAGAPIAAPAPGYDHFG
jgi:thiamine-monophosphate kinase